MFVNFLNDRGPYPVADKICCLKSFGRRIGEESAAMHPCTSMEFLLKFQDKLATYTCIYIRNLNRKFPHFNSLSTVFINFLKVYMDNVFERSRVTFLTQSK